MADTVADSPWWLRQNSAPQNGVNRSGKEVPLVTFPFLGKEYNGNRQTFLDVMKIAQQKLVDQMFREIDATLATDAERVLFREFFRRGSAAAREFYRRWCQALGASIGWQGDRKAPEKGSLGHHDGLAVDVNYDACPYFPTRTGEGEAMTGENEPAGSNALKTQIQNGCRDAGDRAFHLFYAARATHAHVNRSKAAIRTTYAELQRLHWALRFYLDYVFRRAGAVPGGPVAHGGAIDALIMWRRLKFDQQGIITDLSGSPVLDTTGKPKQTLPRIHPDALLFVDDKAPLPTGCLIDAPNWPGKKGILLRGAPLEGADAAQIANAVHAQIRHDHDILACGMVLGRLDVANGKVVVPARRDPCGGFLNVSFDVVAAMMDAGCNVWAMFPGPLGTDVMHFDIASGSFAP